MIDEANGPSLIEMLDKLPDPRDNRGKRHNLAFLLGCVIVAILSNNHTQSSMQRFMKDKIEWLRQLFGRPDGNPISRAQLPRILEVIDWHELNQILEELLNLRIEGYDGEWKAIDGKSLKGTISDPSEAHSHERIVSVVGHDSQKNLQPTTNKWEKSIRSDRGTRITAPRVPLGD